MRTWESSDRGRALWGYAASFAHRDSIPAGCKRLSNLGVPRQRAENVISGSDRQPGCSLKVPPGKPQERLGMTGFATKRPISGRFLSPSTGGANDLSPYLSARYTA